MGIVIQFGSRSPVVCTEITQAHADEIQDLLTEVLGECPACRGLGEFFHKHPITGTISTSLCPCGSTDGDRFDFGGAA